MLAHEPFSDKPACACPVITTFAIATNDWMTNEERQSLWPYTTRIAGSKDTLETGEQRLYHIADWACRTVAPAILESEGYEDLARKVRNLNPVSSPETAVVACKFLLGISHIKTDFSRSIDAAAVCTSYTAQTIATQYNSEELKDSTMSLAVSYANETSAYVTRNFSREKLLDLRLELLDELCPKTPSPNQATVCSIKKDLEMATA